MRELRAVKLLERVERLQDFVKPVEYLVHGAHLADKRAEWVPQLVAHRRIDQLQDYLFVLSLAIEKPLGQINQLNDNLILRLALQALDLDILKLFS